MEQPEATVRAAAAAAAGATHITPVVLHLRPGVREEFLPWLEENFPHLAGQYDMPMNGSFTGGRPAQPKEEQPEKKLDEQLSLGLNEPERRAPKWVRKRMSA